MVSMKLLEGKVSIVTGAARGIGAAIALKLAEQGSDIAFTYVSDSSAEKAAALEAQITALGVKAKAYKSNAGVFEECEAFVNDVLKEFGKIDVCVNNAGISKDNLLLRMTAEQWDEVMDINLKSIFNMTKQVIRPMMKAKSGSIINMSSIVGVRGNAGQSSYAASKAGLIGLTQALACEFGSQGIRVNALLPGGTDTPMGRAFANTPESLAFVRGLHALKRMASPDEIAQSALYLASDASSFTTGSALLADGGVSISRT